MVGVVELEIRVQDVEFVFRFFFLIVCVFLLTVGVWVSLHARRLI